METCAHLFVYKWTLQRVHSLCVCELSRNTADRTLCEALNVSSTIFEDLYLSTCQTDRMQSTVGHSNVATQVTLLSSPDFYSHEETMWTTCPLPTATSMWYKTCPELDRHWPEVAVPSGWHRGQVSGCTCWPCKATTRLKFSWSLPEATQRWVNY